MVYKRLYFWIIFLFSITAFAQIENKKKVLVYKKNSVSKEEKTISYLYCLYNKGDEKTAFEKAKIILQSTKSNRTIACSNLLLAYYFNKRAIIDSSLYYTKQALKFNIR